MKGIKIALLVCLTGILSCQAQTDNSNSSKKEEKKHLEKKEMNLLDEQTKMFGNIFEMAGAGTENPLDGADNYMELIEKMDATEKQKEMPREQYKVYNLSLDPTKKDSLKIMTRKMLESAIEKSKNYPNN